MTADTKENQGATPAPMELRDHFAAALQGILANATLLRSIDGRAILSNVQSQDLLAGMTYVYADAMLAVREKTGV